MNGILICSGTGKTKNIGDYIQSVAQEQFWNKVDCFVERESLNTINSEEAINVIMNGWYMWNPKNFPPSDCLNPLFVSLHINPKCATDFFSEKTISYLKKYEPIGARDKGTQAILEQHGIKSYYSSCLTLTLGLKYKTDEKNGKILFVDPYIFPVETTSLLIKSLFRACIHLIRYPIKAHKLAQKVGCITWVSKYSKWLDRHLSMASFYAIYSKVFTDDLLFGAEYITHILKNNLSLSDDDKMDQARELVRLYSRAKLVITSRIHAALPCLGVETPVIFIPSSGLNSTRENAGRFDGLEELFNVIRWKNWKLDIENEKLKQQFKQGKLGKDVHVENSKDYVFYRDQLIKTVESFCNKNEATDSQ